MRVLIACEYSSRVRETFRARGHDAWSVDLLETEGDPRFHVRGDALTLAHAELWDLMIAFPPCQYLTNSNAWRWDAIASEREQALGFVRDLLDAPIPRIALENPVGAIGTNIRKADQYVQPWHYGDHFQKTTGLWLVGLPLLTPEITTRPDDVQPWCSAGYGPKNDQGQRAVKGRSFGWKDRALTFPGIARAMAEQWG